MLLCLKILLLIISSIILDLQVETIETKAGGLGGYGQANNTPLFNPRDWEIDASGNLNISDRDTQRTCKVDVTKGILSKVIGNGSLAFSGDAGFETLTKLEKATGVKLHTVTSLYCNTDFNENYNYCNISCNRCNSDSSFLYVILRPLRYTIMISGNRSSY